MEYKKISDIPFPELKKLIIRRAHEDNDDWTEDCDTSEAFIWVDTPEGTEYWAQIADIMEKSVITRKDFKIIYKLLKRANKRYTIS